MPSFFRPAYAIIEEMKKMWIGGMVMAWLAVSSGMGWMSLCDHHKMGRMNAVVVDDLPGCHQTPDEAASTGEHCHEGCGCVGGRMDVFFLVDDDGNGPFFRGDSLLNGYNNMGTSRVQPPPKRPPRRIV